MGAKQRFGVQSSIRVRSTKMKETEVAEAEKKEEGTAVKNGGHSDGGYYLECRKDAQCVCRMCKESMTATKDLRQKSSDGVSMEVEKQENRPWPPPFSSSSWSTPCYGGISRRKFNRREISAPSSWSPSSAEAATAEEKSRHSQIFCSSLFCYTLLFVFCAVSVAPIVVSYLWQPRFDAESFSVIGHGSMQRFIRLTDRIDFVQRHIRASNSNSSSYFSVSDCSGSISSAWKLAQDDYFIHSSCDMYHSLVEVVSVWGYSMKTGGILGRSFVDRSFTVLSGRVLEWPEGGVDYIIHEEGGSWTMKRWSASTILLDGNTWVLEYKRKPVYAGFGGFQGLLYLAKTGLRVGWRNIKLISDTAFLVHRVVPHAFSWSEAGVPCPT